MRGFPSDPHQSWSPEGLARTVRGLASLFSCGAEPIPSPCCSSCTSAPDLDRDASSCHNGRTFGQARAPAPGLADSKVWSLQHPQQKTEVEICIVVERQPGEAWGLDVHQGGSRGLIVDKIASGGVLAAHNEISEQKILPKDRILEVNGKGRGNASVLLSECRSADVLRVELVISRGVAGTPPPIQASLSNISLVGNVPVAQQPTMPSWDDSVGSWGALFPPMASCSSVCCAKDSTDFHDAEWPISVPFDADHLIAGTPSFTVARPLRGSMPILSMGDLQHTRATATHLVIFCLERQCAVCQQHAPRIEELARRHQEVMFATVDIAELFDVARELNVAEAPVFFFVHRGAVVKCLSGLSSNDLVGMLEQFVDNFVGFGEEGFSSEYHEMLADGSSYKSQTNGSSTECHQTYADGSSYRGQMKGDARHGRGTWELSSGFYSGGWSDDAFSGYGVQVYADGRKYAGQFLQGQYHGSGEMQWTSEEGLTAYRGQYANGVKHGEGKFRWSDGRSFSGYWQDGKRHGKGACATTDGKATLGEWRCDKLVMWFPAAREAEDLFVTQPGCKFIGDDLETGVSKEAKAYVKRLQQGVSKEEAKAYVKLDNDAVGFTYRNDSPEVCYVKGSAACYESKLDWSTVTRLKLDDALAQKLVQAVPASISLVTIDVHGPTIWSDLNWIERWMLLAPHAQAKTVQGVAKEALEEVQKAAQAEVLRRSRQTIQDEVLDEIKLDSRWIGVTDPEVKEEATRMVELASEAIRADMAQMIESSAEKVRDDMTSYIEVTSSRPSPRQGAVSPKFTTPPRPSPRKATTDTDQDACSSRQTSARQGPQRGMDTAMLQEAPAEEGAECGAVGGEELEYTAFQQAVPPTDGMETAGAEEALKNSEEVGDARTVSRKSDELNERGMPIPGIRQDDTPAIYPGDQVVASLPDEPQIEDAAAESVEAPTWALAHKWTETRSPWEEAENSPASQQGQRHNTLGSPEGRGGRTQRLGEPGRGEAWLSDRKSWISGLGTSESLGKDSVDEGQSQKAPSRTAETRFLSETPGQSSSAFLSCLSEKLSRVEKDARLRDPSSSPGSFLESPRVCVSEFGGANVLSSPVLFELSPEVTLGSEHQDNEEHKETAIELDSSKKITPHLAKEVDEAVSPAEEMAEALVNALPVALRSSPRQTQREQGFLPTMLVEPLPDTNRPRSKTLIDSKVLEEGCRRAAGDS